MQVNVTTAVARRAKLMVNKPFTCDCTVKAWRFDRIEEATRITYGAIWRQINTTHFMLIGKTALPMEMGVNIFMSPTPIRVQKGDIVGIHVDKQGRGTSGIGKLHNCLTTDVLSPKVSDNGWMNNFVLDVGSDLIIDNQCVSLSAICTD